MRTRTFSIDSSHILRRGGGPARPSAPLLARLMVHLTCIFAPPVRQLGPPAKREAVRARLVKLLPRVVAGLARLVKLLPRPIGALARLMTPRASLRAWVAELGAPMARVTAPLRQLLLLHVLLHVLLVPAAGARADPPPPGKAVKILSPRFFPGWQARDVCYPFVVLEAPGRYRMYYSGSGAEQYNDSVWDQWVTGYVTSTDTLAWKFPENYEPVLFARKLMEGDVLDPDELASQFDSVHAVGACIIRDVRNSPEWKAWYTGWSGRTEPIKGGLAKKVEFRIGHATSSDGLAWVKAAGSAGAGAVLGLGEPGQPDSKGAAHPHVLQESGTYRMWYEGYDGDTWRLLHATSPDGRAWTKRGVALDLGTSGSLDERGLRNPLVLKRKGQHELWYQGQSRQRSVSAGFHVLRAVSPDGLAWNKAAGEVALHPDPPISGDEQVLVDSAIVLPGGAVQVFFARQLTTSRVVTYGTIIDRNFHIYAEVVDP